MLSRSTSAVSRRPLCKLLDMFSLFNRLNKIVCLVIILTFIVNSVATDVFLSLGIVQLIRIMQPDRNLHIYVSSMLTKNFTVWMKHVPRHQTEPQPLQVARWQFLET